MPLIIISGYPSSGKTLRATQLFDHFTTKISSAITATTAEADTPPTPADARIARLKCHHISDHSLGLSRDVYREARTEKDARAAAFSAVERVLSKDDIVIADGLNYIKGFRYQLYCAAKAVSTPSCIVHVGTPISTCSEINARLLADPVSNGGYAEDLFENLVYRFEEPNGMNRWDKPLFTVLYEDTSPPLEEIWETLTDNEGKPKIVKPNQATILRPATSSDYLYDLDRTTQEVVSTVLSYQKDHEGEGGGSVDVQGVDDSVELPTSPVSVPQLQRLRRQFIALNRQHPLDKARIGHLFVDYLNDSFQNLGN